MRGFWQRGTDCIFDVTIVDLDTPSHHATSPANILARREKSKKAKYSEACHAQRLHFTPFVASADGLLGSEAQTVLRRLSLLLSHRWHKSYSAVRGYVNARLSISLVRAGHLCLRGARVPTSAMSHRRPIWDGSDALALFR